MALLLNKVWETFTYLKEDVADPRTKDMYLMSSPLPILLILSMYLYIVLKWGPEFMKNRKPINIDKILMVFNVVQIVACAYVVIQLHPYCIFQYNWRCEPVDYSYEESPMKIVFYTWFYMLIKILDLMDTIFFVLRKKFNQVSFLHVYHHSGMVILTWIGVKYVPGGHSLYMIYINSIVHVVMYSYYLLSKYKKSVWWKKYVTQLQLLQFLVIFIIYAQILFQSECDYPEMAAVLGLPQSVIMFVLFANFYYNTYIKKKQDTKHQHSLNENVKNLEPINKLD